MKTKPIIWNHFFLLVCLSLVSLGAYAEAAPTETETETGMAAELTIYSSNANAVQETAAIQKTADATYLGSDLDWVDNPDENVTEY